MKKKISPKVKAIIAQSRKEALRLGHDYIGTEHLLLGIVNEPFSFATKVLVSLGIDIEELREVIDDNAVRGKMSTANLELGELPLNRHAEAVLNTMSIEAAILENEQVCPEHLVLAILKHPKSAGAKPLNSLDVDYDHYKTEMEYVRHEMQSEASQETDKAKEALLDLLPDYVRQQHKNDPESQLSPLHKFGRDITQYVNENHHYAAVERETEIRQMAQILSKKEKSSVLLIGEPGVGKRAIVEEFAHMIQKNLIYRRHYNRIIELDWTALVADTRYRGELEARIKAVLNELKNAPKTILLLTQMYIVFEELNRNGLSIAGMLKPALEHDELKLIGIVTTDKYPSLMADRAMNNHFHQLFINPPSPQQAIRMLENTKLKYENFYNVAYQEGVIETCVRLTHLRGGVLPGKAADLLDEVAAQVRMRKVMKKLSWYENSN